MSARVTADEVREIVETSITDDALATNHITTANLIVDEHLATSGLSDDMLKRIELYLAAHYVALTEERGGLTRNKLGDGDESYANVYEAGYHSTRFGQTALSLDSTGLLVAASQTNLKATFRVI